MRSDVELVAGAFVEKGNEFKMAGLLEEAIEAYRRALELRPDFMEAHANLAVVLHLLGRPAEAQPHAERAVSLAPKLSTPKTTLAMIEGALQGYERTLARLDDIFAVNPDDVVALAAAVYALLKLERAPDALRVAERGCAVRPNDVNMLLSLGGCLWQLGRLDEALATFDRVLELSTDPAMALVRKGEVLTELGRRDEAVAAIEAALALHDDLAPAWYTWVGLVGVAPGDAALATMERALATSPALRLPEDRAIMHFALGRAYDKAGRVDDAFRNLAEGNRLKRAALRYDVADDRAWMRGLAEEFSAERVAALAGAGDPSPLPIFIVGIPRSGTTLVEQILASHPDVHGAGELHHIHRLAPERAPLTREHVRTLGERYLALVQEHAPARPRVVDKMPSNFAYAGLIHAMLPQAKIIHCRRDALDTCWSCYTTLFTGRQDFAFDLAELGSYYRGYRELMEHWRRVLPAGVLYELDYEKLARDVEGTARELLAFCGLDWDDRCVRFYETARTVRTASSTQVRVPAYATSIGRANPYRPYLAPLIAALEGA